MSSARQHINQLTDDKVSARAPRAILSERSAKLHDAHIYARVVHDINGLLQDEGIPLGEHMQTSTSKNLDDVARGTGSLPTYHAREIYALSLDAFAAARKGNTMTAVINIAGAGLNILGFFAGGPREAFAMRTGRPLHKREIASSSSNDHQYPTK
jgi:hypothetical protein